MGNVLRNKYWVLCLVILLGFSVRLFSVNYGLPFVVGPDETRQILDSFSMASRMSLLPQEFAYAALHKYLLLAVYGTYFLLGKAFGVFADKMDFAFKFISQPYNFYLMARLLSVALGTSVIFAVYKTAKLLLDEKAGLLAALLAALNFHLIQLSYWTSSDILVVFISAIAFFYILKFLKFQTAKNAIFAGFFTGLAVSSKLQGVLFIVPLILAILFGKNRWKYLAIALSVFCVGAFIGNAAYIFQGRPAIERIIVLSQEAKFGISSAPVFSHNVFGVILWYAKDLIRQDGIIGLVYILGIIYSCFSMKRENLAFLSLAASFAVSLSLLSLRQVYYLAAFLPAASVFAAVALIDLSRLFRNAKKFVLGGIITLIILLGLKEAILAQVMRSYHDTRQRAMDWVESNIPFGSKIALDWPELNVPLPSDIPFMFWTGNARQYYDTYMPKQIKDAFGRYQDGNIYTIVPVIHQEDADFLPQDMPEEAAVKIRSNPMFVRLYQRFNFFTLEKLRSMGCQYLVLSSFAYSHFLLDSDIFKMGIYNPYIKEDVLSNNRQSEEYDPSYEESALYFLNKRARGFYSPLLLGKAAGVELIKEFSPRFDLGPNIKIYKIEVLK